MVNGQRFKNIAHINLPSEVKFVTTKDLLDVLF